MKRLVVLLVAIALLCIIPVLLWVIDEGNELQVAIIDKTVPDETYREHLGITWVLNHFQYRKKDGSKYNESEDYYGFKVNKADKSYEIKPLLTNYDEYDVIYIADTYGVYEHDLPWVEKEREGARTSLIHGGMELEEWYAMLERLNSNEPATLIAEFNTLASPTPSVVRDQMSDYLGIDWSGWMGRYFQELDPKKNIEIPQWVLDEFNNQWEYSGPGFLLVNDFTHEIVVLELEKHVNSKGISMEFTDRGKEKFKLSESPNYHYWFDIIVPKDGATALATFQWDLTEEGEKLLDTYHIPKEFASLIEKTNKNTRAYYLAGDFNDISTTPQVYQMKGVSKVYKLFQYFSDDSFFWSTYVPVIKQILKESMETKVNEERAVSTKKEEELTYTARVVDNKFEVLQNGTWEEITIKGVNLGMGKPGVFPGEAAITEEEYYRWLTYIGEMGANSIRVYTLHPPGFYRALKRYNDSHEEKLYVFHGVWINEEILEETLDAFQETLILEFQEEMKRVVDVIHGNAIIQPVQGHASGVYDADISEYVIGWIIGIEWYPHMVVNTNEVYESKGDYDGNYLKTVGASPFEHWLAEQMDVIATYERGTYSSIRPLSFTNWVTTDILNHHSEPSEDEDLVSVNPNVIELKNELLKVNQFASYHVYPYYPDFFNYEEEYLQYIDHRGKQNSYAAYLKDLHDIHDIPILIAEFGVPSSRGKTHENPFGWDQGFLSEKEQGEIVVSLLEDILEEGLLGGLIFTWQDEWFKRTWNTMDYDNPDRRPYWSNAQTNEQQFGLLSFDRHKIKIDGTGDEWEEHTEIYYGNDELKSLYIDYDERYLYIRIDRDDLQNGDLAILLDTVPNQGNSRYHQKKLENGAEFLVEINRNGDSKVTIDPYYDFYSFFYGNQLKMLETYKEIPKKDSGKFVPIQYVLNKELYIPTKDEVIPFSSYETGALTFGIGNPEHPSYDSLADYYIDEETGITEIRLPWLLLQFKDPSQREVIGDLYKDGEESSIFIDDIHIAVVLHKEEQWLDTIPNVKEDDSLSFLNYSWDKWDMPLYEERLKQSYYLLQKAFQQIK